MRPEDFSVLEEAVYDGSALSLRRVKINIPAAVTIMLRAHGILHPKHSLDLVVASFHHFSYHLKRFGLQYEMRDLLKEARTQVWPAEELLRRMRMHATHAEASARLSSQPLLANFGNIGFRV